MFNQYKPKKFKNLRKYRSIDMNKFKMDIKKIIK